MPFAATTTLIILFLFQKPPLSNMLRLLCMITYISRPVRNPPRPLNPKSRDLDIPALTAAADSIRSTARNRIDYFVRHFLCRQQLFLGAVHKVRHALFLDPPPPVTLCHISRAPLQKYVTHPGPTSRILVSLVQRNPEKPPCTKSL